METSQDSENSKSELYRLFTKLSDETGQRQRETIDAIMVNDEWNLNLRLGCGRVLKCSPGHSDLRDDLLQETTCLLLSALIRGRIMYHDQGFHRFTAWLRKVVDHAAIYALHGPHPISFDRFFLMHTEELDNLAVEIDTRVGREDLLIAISQLKAEKTRCVVQDWAHGLSIAESARKTGFAISTVCRIRQRGRDELRRLLSVD